MNNITISILNHADSIPDYGRDKLIEDIIPLVGHKIFLTQEQIAERYQVSTSTVKSWCAKRWLTAGFKLPNGTARYSMADILKFEEKLGRKEEK